MSNPVCFHNRIRRLACTLCLCICLVLLAACAPQSDVSQPTTSDGNETSTPELPGVRREIFSFMKDKTYFLRTSDENTIIRNGIDVSEFQKEIDWVTVKNTGITFAIVRIAGRSYTSGILYDDATYAQNIQSAMEVGLDVGAYFFSQAISPGEAIREADYLLELLDGAPLTIPIFIDFEFYGSGTGRLFEAELTPKEAMAICEAFCERIESAGYTAGVYANLNMINSLFDIEWLESNYAVWLAHYTTESEYNGIFDFWQYSGTGRIDGIGVACDANVRLVDETPALQNVACIHSKADLLAIGWDKVPGAYGYVVQRYNTTKGEYETIAELRGAGTTCYQDKGLKPLTAYSYRVCAVQYDNGDKMYGEWSDMITGKTLAPKK